MKFGATVTLINPVTLESSTYDLPAVHWSRSGAMRNYVYDDSSMVDGPCRSASIKPGRFSLECSGPAITFTLDEPTQDSLAVIFSFGSPATRYCMLFDGASVHTDEPGEFYAADAVASKECPGWQQ